MSIETFHGEEQLGSLAIQYQLTGSQAICNPPPGPTSDKDWVVLVALVNIPEFVKTAKSLGYITMPEMKDYPTQSFPMLHPKTKDNLIITCDRRWYYCSSVATRLAKELNLQKRKDRVALFTVMRNML